LAVKIWKEGRLLPKKAVILTIDDGYLSFFTHGWPLLKKYNYTATVFIQTETVGGADFMSWAQIKEIQKAGIEIGNHSASHAYFLNLPAGEREVAFKQDLEKSESELKKHLGKMPKIYAYPSGEWTSEMEMILKKSGYHAAAVQKSGVFCEKTNMMAVPRFPMGGNFGNLEGFKNKSKMKALRVIRTTPESPIYTENPPKVVVELDIKNIQISNIQFFVDGTKAEIAEVNTKTVPPFVTLKAPAKIKGRHTLYTITAPSSDGKSWHWYSYLWVQPADTK
jgi:peptidoglycan/xylan/chitin deacetylase (PgdA/CDA1 family)